MTTVAVLITAFVLAAAIERHVAVLTFRAPTTKKGPAQAAIVAGALTVAYVVGKPGHREQPWAARSDTGKLYRTPDTGRGMAEGDGDADAVGVGVGLAGTVPV